MRKKTETAGDGLGRKRRNKESRRTVSPPVVPPSFAFKQTTAVCREAKPRNFYHRALKTLRICPPVCTRSPIFFNELRISMNIGEEVQ